MWGGRFAMSPAEVMQEINASIGFDKALAPQDIRASKAHAAMLAAQGIISKDDAKKINAGLDRVLEEIEAGRLPSHAALEDVHMNVESRPRGADRRARQAAAHARSRNDQVATDFKLWVRDWIDGPTPRSPPCSSPWRARRRRISTWQCRASRICSRPSPSPSATHPAGLRRDARARTRDRLADARARLNECPLGSAALAGTSFPIDRHMTAQALASSGPPPIARCRGRPRLRAERRSPPPPSPPCTSPASPRRL
jgi:argininosuccinate lyase